MNKIYVAAILFAILLAGYFQLRDTRKVDELCPVLSGRVIYKEDEGYQQARLVSNYYNSKNKYPYVIVYAQNAEDVQNAVLWAKCKEMGIRIRSGGHNHEGYSTGNGDLVIDVSEMKDLAVDQAKKIAALGPGLTNLELYSQLYEKGLTHAGGTCAEVGLSGLVLSGGMGPLLRRVGLTCDTLVSVDIVNAKGEILHATKDNAYKDLFWATCGGGGGNFGVIVGMEIKVFPADDVTWFNIGWNWDQPVEKVIEAWQKFFLVQDDKWFSHLDLWGKPFPVEKLKKQPIKVLGMFWGKPEEAKKLLEPILSIGTPSSVVIEKMTWEKAILAIEESTAVFLTDKPEYKSTGAFAMKSLPLEALDIMHGTLEKSTSPLLNVLLFSMGGSTAAVSPESTAYFYRQAPFFINYSSQWLEGSQDESYKTELTNLRKSLLPYTVGDYIGNPDPDLEDYMESYYGDNAERLRCLKRKYDPDNLFHFEQSIPLSPTGWECGCR